jgi:hypothetical protein
LQGLVFGMVCLGCFFGGRQCKRVKGLRIEVFYHLEFLLDSVLHPNNWVRRTAKYYPLRSSISSDSGGCAHLDGEIAERGGMPRDSPNLQE